MVKILLDFDAEATVKLASEAIVAFMKNEVEKQGHRDTGKLINSMSYELKVEKNVIVAMFSYVAYGRFVNDGVDPKKVRYAIKVIIDWAKRKGIIKSKKDIGIAYAIRAAHRKQGIPTRGSYKYSNNGRRKGFQGHVLKNIDKIVKPVLDTKLINPLQTLFFDMLKQTKI